MATIFIANIGPRDLQIRIAGNLYLPDGGRCPEVLQDFLKKVFDEEEPQELGARALGKWLIERLKSATKGNRDSFFEAVECPILAPALDLALKKVKTLGAVYLCGTDQPESVTPRHRANDTYFISQVIQQWLSHRYEDRLKQIQVLKVGEVPVLWDKAYQLLADLKVPLSGTQEVELRSILKGAQEVFAEISGGIPSLNVALHQVVLGVCGGKARLIQTLENKPGQPSEACFLDTQIFRGDRLIRQLQPLLESYDYKAALDLLEDEIPQPDKPIRKALAALRHANARLNFDFEQALKEIKSYKSGEPFQEWYKSADHQNFADRVKEALGCLEIFRQSHQLIIFVVLAEGILEGLTRLAAEALEPKLQGIYVDENGQKVKSPLTPNLFVPINKLGNQNEELAEYLKQQESLYVITSRGGTVKRWSADEKFYDSIVAYFRQSGNQANREFANQFLSERGQLRACLNRLRNDLLHDLANLSEEGLRQKVQKHLGENANLTTLVKRLGGILSDLSEPSAPAVNPRIAEQSDKVIKTLGQGLEQVTQSHQEEEKIVFDFDEVNNFVLKTLTDTWKIPLPPGD